MSVEVVRVSRAFDGFRALRDVSLSVPTGRLVALELPHLRMRRDLRLTYSAKRELSRAATAFLEAAQKGGF